MKKTTKIRIFKFGTIFSGVITVLLSVSDVIVKNIIRMMMGMEINLNES